MHICVAIPSRTRTYAIFLALRYKFRSSSARARCLVPGARVSWKLLERHLSWEIFGRSNRQVTPGDRCSESISALPRSKRSARSGNASRTFQGSLPASSGVPKVLFKYFSCRFKITGVFVPNFKHCTFSASKHGRENTSLPQVVTLC